MKRFDEAETCYRQAIEANPVEANPYDSLANLLYETQRFDEAEKHYQRALELDSANARIRSNLGNALRHLKRSEEAETIFRKGIEFSPTDAASTPIWGPEICIEIRKPKMLPKGKLDPSIKYHYHLVLFRCTKSADDAKKAFEKAILLDPKHFGAMDRLSSVLRETGRLQEALLTEKRALEIAPDEFIINLGIASIQKSAGNIGEAKKFVERSRQLIAADYDNYWYDLACRKRLLTIMNWHSNI
jgi:tetratricopeptide (TPR) repeat protein